jgi:hypothetical protein
MPKKKKVTVEEIIKELNTFPMVYSLLISLNYYKQDFSGFGSSLMCVIMSSHHKGVLEGLKSRIERMTHKDLKKLLVKLDLTSKDHLDDKVLLNGVRLFIRDQHGDKPK